LVTLAGALFAECPAAAAKVTQGITAVTAADAGEAARISLIEALTTAQLKYASSIALGAVSVDPDYAGQFTNAVFTSILASPGGPILLAKDAPNIATGVGTILGANGDVLTQVANTFGMHIANGDLPASSAATYAKDVIGGAVKGLPSGVSVCAQTVPPGNAAIGVGGRFNLAQAGLTTATANDLTAIVDVLANGIITADLNAGTLDTKAASQIGAVASAVAKFTKNETFDTGIAGVTQPQPVAAFLAGTLADLVTGLTGSDLTARTDILNAISNSVTAVTNSNVDTSVRAGVAAAGTYPVVGEVAPQVFAVINL
jgi:hypothetical protein